MFEIYITKDAQNAMTRDDVYLVTQTMRIFNGLRLFSIIADDIRRRGPDDILNQKKYIELHLSPAANLNEVLVALEEDLFPRYKTVIKNQAILAQLTKWEERIKQKDETTRVLAAIRNKHAFHVAHDRYYPWNYITEAPATDDKVIAVGETMQGAGWLFTWDIDLIFEYLRDHALEQKGDPLTVAMRVKKIINGASVDLWNLFEKIVAELLLDRCYITGNKEEAERDYRKDPQNSGAHNTYNSRTVK